AFQGWPPNLLAYLHQIGDDDALIESIRRIIFVQDVTAASGTIPAALAPAAFLARLRADGAALTPFAGIPGQPNCHGTSVSALATQSGGASNPRTPLGFPRFNPL